MKPNVETDPLQHYAVRLSNWARGDVWISETVVVTEHLGSISWLGLTKTGLLGNRDFVLCALPHRERVDLPDGPGTWVRGTGGTSSPGDDVGLDRDLYIQTMDYGSLRYLNILGPTVIRIMTGEDAKALLTDVESTLRTGYFSKQLLHPMVELGDRCALVGSSDCPGRHLRRLHIDRAGNVRTSPSGQILGEVGSDREALLARAASGPTVDPCLSEEPSILLSRYGYTGVHTFLVGLDAVRVLSQRSARNWQVLSWSDTLVSDRGAFVPRCDQMLLTDGSTHVLYDSASKRAFRLENLAAEIAGAILLSRFEDEAHVRLHAQGRTEITLDYIRAFREELHKRGLELAYAQA